MNKNTIKQKQENSLVEIVDQSGVELGVEKILNKNSKLLPNNVAIEKIKASAGFYISNREDLMALNKDGKLQMLYGVLKEALLGCEAGIDYDIVPFKGKPTVIRKKEGYFKVIDMIKPSEIIRFVSNVITTDDKFEFNPVTEELVHEMYGERYQDFEHIEGAYAYIKFANGFEKTVYMSKEDLEHLKEISPSGNSNYSPWNSNSIKMCKTKVVKELAKELCTLWSGRVNSILSKAIDSDEISVKSIDEKGNIINDDTIYQEAQIIEQVEEKENFDEEEVDMNEL